MPSRLRRVTLGVALGLALSGCALYDQSLPPKIDAGPDSGVDAGADGQIDAATDAGADADTGG